MKPTGPEEVWEPAAMEFQGAIPGSTWSLRNWPAHVMAGDSPSARECLPLRWMAQDVAWSTPHAGGSPVPLVSQNLHHWVVIPVAVLMSHPRNETVAQALVPDGAAHVCATCGVFWSYLAPLPMDVAR